MRERNQKSFKSGKCSDAYLRNSVCTEGALQILIFYFQTLDLINKTSPLLLGLLAALRQANIVFIITSYNGGTTTETME